MRLKTSLWVKSYIRTCFAKGAHCAVLRKGDADAGQVFIKCNHLDGSFSLYGPAPVLNPGAGEAALRYFEAKAEPGATEIEIENILNTQLEFDPDIWIIEVESRGGEVYLETIADSP